MKKKLAVLTGAGISAESGIRTFRDADGLWEGHDVMEVASYEGWLRNPRLVMDFYNERRRQLHQVEPNAGHLGLAALEKDFDVHIITQNVDDLHEKAGSTNVLHLHGELLKARSTVNKSYILDWENDLNLGDYDEAGNQLRPHIVWFGEEIPLLGDAVSLTQESDIFVVAGTSLQVYPAAGLLQFTNPHVPIFYIDPNPAPIHNLPNELTVIAQPASTGIPILAEKLRRYL